MPANKHALPGPDQDPTRTRPGPRRTPKVPKKSQPGFDFTSEQQLTRAIIEACNATGRVKLWRNQSGKVRVKGGFMRLSPKGTPDILGYDRTGRMVALEVKLPGGKPDPPQVEWLLWAIDWNVIAYTVTSIQQATSLLLQECP